MVLVKENKQLREQLDRTSLEYRVLSEQFTKHQSEAASKIK